MAWYNSSKDLQKAVSTKNVVKQGSKAVGDVYSAAIKQPTQATYQSIKTGSAQPLKEYGGNVWSQGVKQPLQQLGQATGITPKESGGPASVFESGPDYSKNTLALTSYGNNLTTNFGSQIGANEDPNAISQNVRNQYAALGSLAKMREGANAQSEQNAIQRRLASTGMGSSGAGLRLQNLASQQSARRGAETQLGIAAEQAGKEAGMQEAAIARNMQREQMRLGAAESAAGREFAVQQAEKQDIKDTAQFELEKSITQENQKIARAVQRYNEQGMFGQMFTDLLGRPLSLGKR